MANWRGNGYNGLPRRGSAALPRRGWAAEETGVKLFDDGEIVALDKPSGVSMATSSAAGRSEQDVVARLLSACGEACRETFRLVHRLDVGTSGVVLLARSAAAHRALSQEFQSGGVHKTYRALVWGHPRPAEGTIDEAVGRDRRDGRKMKVRSDGKSALTVYRTLARLPSVADLALSPKTGRTHQIRVHLSARGHPIVGDDLYGGASRWRGVRDTRRRRALAAVDRPLLHAQRLEIPKMGIDVSAPLPEDYESVLRALTFCLPNATGSQ